MTEEQIKQKAEAEADKVIIGSGMDRASVIHLKHLLVTMYIQGATEATKELQAQIEKMKCCGNCCVGDKACYVRTQEHVNICPSWKLKEIKEK